MYSFYFDKEMLYLSLLRLNSNYFNDIFLLLIWVMFFCRRSMADIPVAF